MRKAKEPPKYDFNETCPHCGRSILPHEYLRSGEWTMICPACKKEFELPKPARIYKTS
jgi:rRNA maturation protein Nop10